MKKLMIVMVLVSAVFAASAQKRLVTKAQNLKDTGKLEEAFKTINQAIDPSNEKVDKTINWPKTWEVRGEIFQAISKSDKEEIKKLSDDPLTDAFKCFKKALEVDEKGRFDNSIKVKLTLLSNDLINQAIDAFNNNDYKKALLSFENVLELQNINIIKADNPEAVDTVIIYNTGLAAYNAKEYDKAIKYYKEAAKHNYNGAKIHTLISSTYQLKGDTLGALKSLQDAFEKYPKDNDILNGMIQLYLDTKQIDSAMKYLNMAIERNPNNATYYFAKGTLYEKIEDEPNAVETYSKAIEIDDEYFDAYYNLGAVYYNKGVKQIDVANDVPTNDNKRYEEELKKADEWFIKALPYMEKCHSLKPDDVVPLESLKNLYYRLKKMDKYNEILQQLGE